MPNQRLSNEWPQKEKKNNQQPTYMLNNYIVRQLFQVPSEG